MSSASPQAMNLGGQWFCKHLTRRASAFTSSLGVTCRDGAEPSKARKKAGASGIPPKKVRTSHSSHRDGVESVTSTKWRLAPGSHSAPPPRLDTTNFHSKSTGLLPGSASIEQAPLQTGNEDRFVCRARARGSDQFPSSVAEPTTSTRSPGKESSNEASQMIRTPRRTSGAADEGREPPMRKFGTTQEATAIVHCCCCCCCCADEASPDMARGPCWYCPYPRPWPFSHWPFSHWSRRLPLSPPPPFWPPLPRKSEFGCLEGESGR
mmetsp:Transcript_54920/g.178462  ORF Transcript_54920/g.178462 Transcript_54920/m.178462 type:complete len:265 (-) Transcript_54920:700-1494(-)